jgi:hypothetical protein
MMPGWGDLMSGSADRQRTDGLRAVTLRGRLGNQLFLFSLLRAMGDRPVLVDDLRSSALPLRETLVPGAIRRLSNREVLSLRQPPRIHRGRSRLITQVERHPENAVSRWLRALEYREQQPGAFDPAVRTRRAPVLFNGYFQDERYFADAADAVVSDFRPAPPAVADFLGGLDRRLGAHGPTMAVVVRAGADYQVLGWVLPPAWYRDAVELAAERVGHPRFVVFSDVPRAAEAMAATLRDVGPATSAACLDPVSQLHLIGRLNNAVICDSSFAWWGAWLGDYWAGFSPDRLVVVPDPWLPGDLAATPGRWTRVPVPTSATS